MSFQSGEIIKKQHFVIQIYQILKINQISLQNKSRISKLSLRKNKKSQHFGRTSSFIKGSLTIEASIVMTIFVFFLASLIQIMGLMINESALIAMTHNCVRKGTQSIIHNMDLDLGQMSGSSVAYFELKNQYPYPQEIHLKNILGDANNLNLSVYIEEKTLFPFVKEKFRIGSRGYARYWIGQKRKKAVDYKGEEVYVTQYGKVYHRDINCTYLKPQIQSVSKGDLKNRRNENGRKYHKCPYCDQINDSQTVYITTWGTSYHQSIDCSRLKRVVEIKELKSIEINCSCSKCGGK